MIEINLIPEALRKGQKTSSLTINIPRDVLLGVGSALLLLIVTVHLVLGVIWLNGIGQLSSWNKQWQQVQPDKTILDSMTKESGDLKKKINAIQSITTQKSALWAPKFNAISDALPRGVWLKRMTLDKIGLTIEGSVVSRSRNEINNVGWFLSALKKNKEFMKDFASLEENSIQGSKANAIEVTDFSVMAKLKNETGPK